MPDALDGWSHLVGSPNIEDTELTQEQFDLWKADPTRTYICGYCFVEVPASTRMYCPRCKEFKGIIPAIPGWSLI